MSGPVLCPVDLSETSGGSLAVAEAVRQAELRGTELVLLAVVQDVGMAFVAQYFPENYETEMLEKAKAELDALAAREVPAAVPHRTEIAHGHVAEEILRVAGETAAGLIVIASHQPDTLRTLFVASVADKIVHHATQSVMVVRANA